MAIGVFDSGVGGLTIHRALVDRFPEADFVFLGDQANVPYGGRPGEETSRRGRVGIPGRATPWRVPVRASC